MLRWTCRFQFVVTTEKLIYLKPCRCHAYLILSTRNVILFPHASSLALKKRLITKKSGQWKSLRFLLRVREVAVALRSRFSGVDNRSPPPPPRPLCPFFFNKVTPSSPNRDAEDSRLSERTAVRKTS
jgi:hypothetical protein